MSIQAIERTLHGAFYRLGLVIGNYPRLVAILSLLLSVCLTVAPLFPASKLIVERSAPRLWNPTSAQTFKDWEESLKFGGGELYPAAIIIRPAETDGELLTSDIMKQILYLHEDVVSEIGDPGSSGSFKDWCVKGDTGGEDSCVVENFLAMFDYNLTNVPDDDEGVLAMVQWFDVQSPVEASLGGVERDSEGKVLGAKSLMLIYDLIKSSSPKFSTYQSLLISSLTPSRYPLLIVDAITESTFDNDMVDAIRNDIPWLLAAIALVILWLAVTLGWERKHLALSALITTVFSISVALGIQGIAGWKICSLNFFVSFVVVGVGVDDLIVLDDCYQDLKKKRDSLGRESSSDGPKELIAETLSKAGVAILLTSCTSVVAFLVGAFTDLPAVVYFCRNAALSFTWCFFLNVTLFPSLLFLDETLRATERGAKSSQPRTPSISNFSFDRFCSKFCSFLDKPVVSAVVVASTLAIAWWCLGEALEMETGMKPTETVASDSTYTKFMNLVDSCFSDRTRSIGLHVYGLDYGNETSIVALFDMIERVESQPTVVGKVGGIGGHWLKAYYGYLLEVKGIENPVESFGSHWSSFLSSSYCLGGSCSRYSLDVIGEILPSGTIVNVTASRFKILERSPFETTGLWRVYQEVKEASEVDLEGVEVMVSTRHFLAAETDEVIWDYLLKSLTATMVSVFLVCFILSGPAVSVLVLTTMILLDLTLLGLSSLLSVKLSVVSFICVIMSVGLSVDYILHMSHAVVKYGPLEGINSMGISVFKGSLTTMLGIA
eukprot:CAMPEP_0118667992 /NCGR_PEP_ID=MMETSP0785-20121206/20099_1 /TAXON_ID=91992 /ORGANISM="Bolidomonas pacifica, Strain CCMP 1866" /LENGTH=775 /DNA_ID=CAMNT_0006562517 /DNA_START=257 /DNA_END=2581 /DNA_ORIENTATION=+